MFDVDCPRTPDGDDDGGMTKNTKGKIVPSQNSRPPLPPARSRSASVGSVSAAARGITTTTQRTTHRNSQFSPRPRGGGKRTHAKGLEPEEYIATPTMPLPSRQSPVASFVVPTPTLASSTQRRQNSVSTGSQHHVSPVARSTNPFDVDSGEGW